MFKKFHSIVAIVLVFAMLVPSVNVQAAKKYPGSIHIGLYVEALHWKDGSNKVSANLLKNEYTPINSDCQYTITSKMYVGNKLVSTSKVDDLREIDFYHQGFDWHKKQSAIYTFDYKIKIKGYKAINGSCKLLREPESTIINYKKRTVKVKFDKYVNCIMIPYDTKNGESKYEVYTEEGSYKLPKASFYYDPVGVMIKDNELYAISQTAIVYDIEDTLANLGLTDGSFSYFEKTGFTY